LLDTMKQVTDLVVPPNRATQRQLPENGNGGPTPLMGFTGDVEEANVLKEAVREGLENDAVSLPLPESQNNVDDYSDDDQTEEEES